MNKSPVSCFSATTLLLTCLFIGLKLADYISWSWWAVFIPVYVYIAMYLVLFFLLILVADVDKKK